MLYIFALVFVDLGYTYISSKQKPVMKQIYIYDKYDLSIFFLKLTLGFVMVKRD